MALTEKSTPPTAGSATARVAAASRRQSVALRLGLAPAVLVALLVGTLTNDAFLTADNLRNVLQQSSELAIVVVAVTLLLLTGKFDLSLESTVGFAPMVAAWLVVPAAAGGVGVLPSVLGVFLLFAVGAVVGVTNGLLVARLRLNAFIVTLAMLILLRGATLGVADGRTLADLPVAFTYLGSTNLVGLPFTVWIAGALFVAAHLFLRYHRHGRALYAIGGNPTAARAAGIGVRRTVFVIFVVAGLLAALAGLLLTGRLAAITAGQGQNMIFTVMAAAVIGGISLNGGRGSVAGALLGVLLLGLISNILTLSQISSFWIDAANGAIILVALLLQRATGETSEDF